MIDRLWRRLSRPEGDLKASRRGPIIGSVTSEGPVTRRRANLACLLCVDDEPYILDSLRDALRRHFDITDRDQRGRGSRASAAGPGGVLGRHLRHAHAGDVRRGVPRRRASSRRMRPGSCSPATPMSRRRSLPSTTGAAVPLPDQAVPGRGAARDLPGGGRAAPSEDRRATAARETLKGSVKALADVLALASARRVRSQRERPQTRRRPVAGDRDRSTRGRSRSPPCSSTSARSPCRRDGREALPGHHA